MDDQGIRRVLVEALEIGAVAAIHRPELREPFLAGEGDVELAGLDMDSLARMELCIAIEVETGVSLTPDELDGFATLGDLARQIAARSQ
ncbi:MAG: acyl carrier protein [Alphaproteobacteria bacterium]